MPSHPRHPGHFTRLPVDKVETELKAQPVGQVFLFVDSQQKPAAYGRGGQLTINNIIGALAWQW